MQVNRRKRRLAVSRAQAIVSSYDPDIVCDVTSKLGHSTDCPDGERIDRRADRVDRRILGQQARSFGVTGRFATALGCARNSNREPMIASEFAVRLFRLDIGVAALGPDKERDPSSTLLGQVRK